MEIETFTIGDTDHPHEIGNVDCGYCWTEHPLQCECGGLIHTAFGDEDSDCNYWLYKRCDRCGEDYCEKDN